ncbi:MAG: isoprenylcysteine carboxylmethyltransferase family protein [Candidatus Binataceae bacterium]
MIGDNDTPFRLIAAAELVAMVAVRDYYSFSRSRESIRERIRRSAEAAWLTAAMGAFAILHFGGVIVYIAMPAVLGWCTFHVAGPIRWAGIAISVAGAAGEVWAAISLGTNYSPLLRVGKSQVLVTTGPYRWIRHPLYSFGLPLMLGWGIAARNWLIIASGTVVVAVVMTIRAPREEAMMREAFGQSYSDYMSRTGRFIPRVRAGMGIY